MRKRVFQRHECQHHRTKQRDKAHEGRLYGNVIMTDPPKTDIVYPTIYNRNGR